MAKKRKKSRLSGKVVGNAKKRQSSEKSYGYLNLPKDLPVLNISEAVDKRNKIKLDIIPYIVKNKGHMDADPELETAQVGEPWYKLPILVHRNVGPENEAVVSPKTFGKKCPIIEARKEQQAEGVDKDELIKYPSLRNLYIVIPVDNKKLESKPHIWDVANGNFQALLDQELLEDPDEYGDFCEPESGKTLEIRFSEESFAGNEYLEASRIDFLDRDEEYEDSIMEEVPCLDDIVKILSYDDLSNLMMGVEVEEEEEEEPEEDEPFKKRRSKKKVKEEEEDPEEEEQEEEEEEEDEKPKRRRRREKKVKEDECPSGHNWGEDWDNEVECDGCPVYDACGDAYEEMD